MAHKFSVEIKGYFYTLELYDRRGRECFDVATAACAAEEEYGDNWLSVFNGAEAITREEYLNQEV